MIELAIVLEDTSLHHVFLEQNGLGILMQLLRKSLVVDDNCEPCTSVISSIVTALLHIASFNTQVRKDLSTDNDVLLDLLRLKETSRTRN